MKATELASNLEEFEKQYQLDIGNTTLNDNLLKWHEYDPLRKLLAIILFGNANSSSGSSSQPLTMFYKKVENSTYAAPSELKSITITNISDENATFSIDNGNTNEVLEPDHQLSWSVPDTNVFSNSVTIDASNAIVTVLGYT